MTLLFEGGTTPPYFLQAAYVANAALIRVQRVAVLLLSSEFYYRIMRLNSSFPPEMFWA
jgi:hypothetical protein